MKLPITVPHTFRIIAHRGASAYAPENTLSAFKLAVQMGVREVELDTQLSSDGQVVLCHDRTLKRYGYGPKIVENMRCKELTALDVGSWFSPFLFPNETMPTLEDVFKEFTTTLTYHIEIKGTAKNLPKAIAHDITTFQLEPHCMITSFSYPALQAMRSISSTIRLGWLVEQVTDDILAKAQQLGLYQICLNAAHMKLRDISQARQIVQEVRAWGVTGTHSDVIHLILHLLDLGCDGMTINNPDWVTYELLLHADSHLG